MGNQQFARRQESEHASAGGINRPDIFTIGGDRSSARRAAIVDGSAIGRPGATGAKCVDDEVIGTNVVKRRDVGMI